jgi:hypothetical protein
MKRINYLLLVSIVISSFLSSCLYHEYDELPRLRIRNNSDIAVYYVWSPYFPDTTFLGEPSPFYNKNYQKIEAHTLQKKNSRAFDKSQFMSEELDTIDLCILDAEVVETVPWDTIKKYDLVLKRYLLSESDLDAVDWIIDYP